MIYGIYNSKNLANKALNTLPKALIKHNKPFVDRIKKHKKLYYKYNDKYYQIAPIKIVNKPTVKKNIKSSENVLRNVDFLKAPNDYFTINITTLPKNESLQKFLLRYNLHSNAYSYRFGKSKSNKIIYGVYSSYKDAKTALKNLDSTLFESNDPYVDYVSKHKKLYNKYN